MPLPISRNTIYAPGSQLLSEDMNDIQNSISGLLFRTEHRYNWDPDAGSLASAAQDQPVLADAVEATSGAVTMQLLVEAAGAAPFATPFPTIRFYCGDTAVSEAAIIHGKNSENALPYIVANLDDVAIGMGFAVGMETVGANGVDIYVGMSGAPTNEGDQHDANKPCFALRKRSADTNWQLTAYDGSGPGPTVDDTGVPPVADVLQRFQLEYYGVNTPVGVLNGFATVRLYIDGAQVAEGANENVPSGAQPLGFFAQVRADATGPAATFEVHLGPVNINVAPFAA